jgi:methyl-accepting chemotaxis protein
MEILFIVSIIVIQLIVFNRTRIEIVKLRSFFPDVVEKIIIKKVKVPKHLSTRDKAFDNFIAGLPDSQQDFDEDTPFIELEDVELLIIPEDTRRMNPLFSNVINSTNSYLCKNRGSSADFNILQDICERHIDRQDNIISNLINVPLFIGLGGTFLGIIFGLSGIDFTDSAGNLNSDSVQNLLYGVIGAMSASFAGLILTVTSSAWFYRKAVYQNDSNKNQYYDLIQRELLPVLNLGMAGSLNSFKSVLDHFIQRFGENIEDYSQSAEKLNENLKLQQTVLEEINKLSLTKTANKISEVFLNLNEASEHLDSFKDYQPLLNQNLEKFNVTLGEMQSVMVNFKQFNTSLNKMGTAMSMNLDLQSQFKDSLETHFPSVKPAQEVWRGHVDELNEDIKGVYSELNNYFKQSSLKIQDFVQNNENFFAGMNDIQNSIKIFVDNSKIQTEQYKNLGGEMTEIKNEFRSYNERNTELNKDLVEAIKSLTIKLEKISHS